jgi:hypothetical protein
VILRAWGAAVLRPYMSVLVVFGVGGVASKPRDLGNDRGYRVVVDLTWVKLHPNPHPSKAEGAAPNGHRVCEVGFQSMRVVVERFG